MDMEEFANIVSKAAPALGTLLAPETGGASLAIGTIVGAIATAFGASTKEPLATIANCMANDSKCVSKLKALEREHCNVGAFPE